MGVVISAKPSNWRERRGLRLGLLVLIATGVVVASWWLVALRGRPDQEWSPAQLAQAMVEHNVSRLRFSGDRVVVETPAGVRALVHNPTGDPNLEFIKALGVSEEHLKRIEIVTEEPAGPFAPGNLLLWFCSAPIVIMLLGGFLFSRFHRERNKV